MSPSRGRRRRGAPAPRPHAAPSCKPPRGCSARLRLYSQAGAARAAGGGGPRGAGGGRWGRAARGGRPHPCPRAAGAVRGAGTREKRAVGEGVRGCGERESCTRRLSVHLARPPLPPEPEPEPGPVPWGRGEGQAGARRESPGPGGPAAWGSSVSGGVGWAGTPQFGLNSGLGLLSRRSLRSRGRLPGLGLGLHPDPTSGPACASSAPRARPALRPHKLVSLLCWALLELVPLTPRFIFFLNWGFYFAGKSRREAAFFLSPARARFPAPRRAWVPPLAGSGAGCTLVAVHAVGGHRFPAPAPAACAPPPARSGPSSLRPTSNGRAQTLAESPRAGLE